MRISDEEKRIENKLILHEFRRKISWSITIRYGLVLLGLILFPISSYLGDSISYSLTLIGSLFAYNLVSHIIYRFKKFTAPWQMVLFSAIFQIFDVFSITFLIYITGWLESPYWFLYLVMIIVSGFGLYFYYSLAVFFIALFSSVFYMGLLFMTYYNIFPLQGSSVTLTKVELLQSIFSNHIERRS